MSIQYGSVSNIQEQNDKPVASFNVVLRKHRENLENAYDITDAIEPPRHTTALWDAPSIFEFLLFPANITELEIDTGDIIEFFVEGNIKYKGIIVDSGVELSGTNRVISKNRLMMFQSTHTTTQPEGHTALDLFDYFMGNNERTGYININSNNFIYSRRIGTMPKYPFPAYTYQIGTISKILNDALKWTTHFMDDEWGILHHWQIRDNYEHDAIELRELQSTAMAEKLAEKSPDDFLWVGGARINPDDKDIGNITSFTYTKSIEDINTTHNQILISHPVKEGSKVIQAQFIFRATDLYDKWGMRQKAYDSRSMAVDFEKLSKMSPNRARQAIINYGKELLMIGARPKRKIEFTAIGDANYISRFVAGEIFFLYLPDYNIGQWMWVKNSEARYYKDYAQMTIEGLYFNFFDINSGSPLDPQLNKENIMWEEITNNDRLYK